MTRCRLVTFLRRTGGDGRRAVVFVVFLYDFIHISFMLDIIAFVLVYSFLTLPVMVYDDDDRSCVDGR